MKNNIIIILISVVLSVTLSVFLLRSGARFGATILTTNSSDTIETFRTNVNASLTSLNTNAFSTTTANTFAAIQNFSSGIGVGSSTPLGNIGIGTGTATSSISGGFYCQQFKDETGRRMFIKLATSGSQVFSTSTVSCL